MDPGIAGKWIESLLREKFTIEECVRGQHSRT
jgi:hypothetical protein